MGIVTVLWEKWIEFKRDFVKITLAAMIAPLLYVVVFGRGIGELSGGQPYLNFLVPGAVSYTHLDVYKRQSWRSPSLRGWLWGLRPTPSGRPRPCLWERSREP